MINKFRLDKNSQPERYEIFIEPDLENEKFTGNEFIKLSIKKPTKQIKSAKINRKQAKINPRPTKPTKTKHVH